MYNHVSFFIKPSSAQSTLKWKFTSVKSEVDFQVSFERELLVTNGTSKRSFPRVSVLVSFPLVHWRRKWETCYKKIVLIVNQWNDSYKVKIQVRKLIKLLVTNCSNYGVHKLKYNCEIFKYLQKIKSLYSSVWKNIFT